MAAVPPEAAVIPAPDPVPAVVIVTWLYCWWYADAQDVSSGYSSVLPVSVSVSGAGPGPLGSRGAVSATGPGSDWPGGGATVEQAARTPVRAMPASADSRREYDATAIPHPVPGPSD